MAATLKLTAATTAALDLSSYLNVQEDEGLDPADGGFMEPQFNESAIGAGQGLVNIDEQNKELVWPLMLKAASKDALHTLVQTVRLKLNEPGVRVEWRDDGASLSTFFDLEFGRFDPGYRYFRARQKWIGGNLTCWVRPYGHTATYRGVASSQGTAPFVRLSIASVAGDAEAAAQHLIATPSGAYAQWAIVSRVPTSGVAMTSFYMGPNFSLNTPLTATLVGSSAVAASQYSAWAAPTSGYSQLLKIGLPTVDVQGIPHRVLAVVRSQHQQGAGFKVVANYSGTEVALGPTAVATSGRWQLLDLGVLRIPSSVPSFVVDLNAYGGGLASGAIPSQATQALLATYPIQVNWLAVLPEADTVVVPVSMAVAAASYQVSKNEALGFGATGSLKYFDDFSAGMRGAAPNLKPGANGLYVGLAPRYDTERSSYPFTAEIGVCEQFSFQR